MIHTRIFVLGVSSVSLAGAAMLVACGDRVPRTFVVDEFDEPDASDVPGVNPPAVDHDAGIPDADAAPPKPVYDASDEPVVCTTTPCVTQLVAGQAHFCALLSDGSVRCWGRDNAGVLGRGAIDAGSSIGAPSTPVVGITNATQISSDLAGQTTCARTAEGRVKCWGSNLQALLGLQASPAVRDFVSHPTPSDVAITAEIARVDVGPMSACAISTSGDVYCWGNNVQSQLARPDAGTGTANYHGPALSDVLDYKLTRITLGSSAVFGLTNDGRLVGWGEVSGRDSSLVYSSVPTPLPALSDVTSFATGADDIGKATFCAIADGKVYCWGGNRGGQLGTGVPEPERLPAPVWVDADDKTFPQRLALARGRSCVRMTDGTIQCCGGNGLGQLGTGDAGAGTSLFGRVTVLDEPAVQVAGSTATTCALLRNGKVVCWGGNANGELGQGTTDDVAHPLPTPIVFQ